MPTADYLETSGGPVPIRNIEWVEVSLFRIIGGIAGQPTETVEIKSELLSILRQTSLNWELHEGILTIDKVIDAEPVQLVRVLNPFGPSPPR